MLILAFIDMPADFKKPPGRCEDLLDRAELFRRERRKNARLGTALDRS
ncbi:hypothetical protein [Bosea sp. (in: a-proteobacteria)]|nr:hypothetical protein [Bosea sp. (in: a-proteobacteria)]MDP3406682.1 hypothetical protein [Bosea sp. (in: a-proteobacteria)]